MRLNQYVLPIAIGLAFIACTEKDPVVQPQADSQPIALLASIDEGNQTGTRVTSGTIEEGIYYLSFADPDNTETLQTIETLFESGTGYPWVYEAASEEGQAPQSYPLNWENVTTSGRNATFYLDNVETDETTQIIQLGEEYAASEYNAEADDKNDIVWGKLPNVAWNTATLSFTGNNQLTHRMSRVRVEIGYEGVDQPTDPVYTVSLSGVKTIPASFNRTTGAITPNTTTSSIDLLKDGELTEEGNFTPSWILPPQTFTDGRPELTIQVLAGGETTTYRGTLPAYMFPNTNTPTDEDDFEFGGEPQPLAFQAGKLLTIRVTLVEEVGNRDILFLPAVVEEWNNIGTIGGLISRQLGIYDEADWEEVVNAYNEDPSESNPTLKRFGTYNNGKWTIHIFANIGDETATEFPLLDDSEHINLKFTGGNVYGKDDIDDLVHFPDTGGNEESQEPTIPDEENTQTPIEGQEE